MRKIFSTAMATLCSGILIVSGSLSNMHAKALDNGIYTAKSTPYYVHPVTRVVENSGGIDSVGIGQPMTDSAPYPQVLMEVDPNGNTYATVKIQLMYNIEDAQFWVQENGNAQFYNISYDVMQENLDVNTTDFRMQIPSENCYLRSSFYVVPMDRYVIFYIGFSDLQPGSSDFITSVEVLQPTDSPQEEPEPTEEETTQPTEETTESETETTAESTTIIESTVVSTAASETTTAAVNEDDHMPSVGGNSDNPGNGVMIYDENGNMMQLSAIIDGSAESTAAEFNRGFTAVFLAVCGGVVVVGGIAYAIVRRKKGSK